MSELPSLPEDVLELTQSAGSFRIRTIAGTDLTGGVAVCCKCTDENGCPGGLTFRTAFYGLTAGTVDAGRAYGKNRRVVLVTYEE